MFFWGRAFIRFSKKSVTQKFRSFLAPPLPTWNWGQKSSPPESAGHLAPRRSNTDCASTCNIPTPAPPERPFSCARHQFSLELLTFPSS